MIRAITLNIGYGMLLEELVAYIDARKASTQLFCFQEVDMATKLVLDELLSTTHVCHYATKFDKDEKFLLASYIDRSYVVSVAETLLQDTEDVGFALTNHIKDAEGNEFRVTNVHGFPRPGAKLDTEKRIEQTTQLIASAEPTIPHIVLGDFNLLPGTQSIELFKENGFQDLLDEFHIPTTRNEVIWKRFPENKQLFADYVFVKNGEHASWHLATEPDIISDHLPLVLNFDLQGLRYFNANTTLVSNSGNNDVSQVLNAAN